MLRQREEVLEICYWYQGEGFGESFTPAALQSFLPLATERIAEIMQALTVDGDLAAQGHGFQLTEAGREKASRLFHETFAEFQTPSHFECTAGCCDSEDDCDHDHHPPDTHQNQHSGPTHK